MIWIRRIVAAIVRKVYTFGVGRSLLGFVVLLCVVILGVECEEIMQGIRQLEAMVFAFKQTFNLGR